MILLTFEAAEKSTYSGNFVARAIVFDRDDETGYLSVMDILETDGSTQDEADRNAIKFALTRHDITHGGTTKSNFALKFKTREANTRAIIKFVRAL
jgi:hypothetical protein